MRTSGAFLLQEKKPERLVGTASAGVAEDGEAYVRIGFSPTEGILWLSSPRALRLQRNLAIELIAVLQILATSTLRLDGVEATLPAAGTSGGGKAVRSVEPPADGILECNFDGVDAVLRREPDGLAVLILSARAAMELSNSLIYELGRIAMWSPDQSSAPTA